VRVWLTTTRRVCTDMLVFVCLKLSRVVSCNRIDICLHSFVYFIVAPFALVLIALFFVQTHCHDVEKLVEVLHERHVPEWLQILSSSHPPPVHVSAT